MRNALGKLGIQAPVHFKGEFGVILLMGPHDRTGYKQIVESIRANDRVRVVAFEQAPADGGEPSPAYRTYTLWIVPNRSIGAACASRSSRRATNRSRQPICHDHSPRKARPRRAVDDSTSASNGSGSFSSPTESGRSRRRSESGAARAPRGDLLLYPRCVAAEIFRASASFARARSNAASRSSASASRS